MRKKINKVTVATRITIPLRDTLDEEAGDHDLSFCRYIEHLLINRDHTANSQVEGLKQELVLAQEEKVKLMEQIEALQAISTSTQTREVSEIESEHPGLLNRIEELENQVEELEEEIEMLNSSSDETIIGITSCEDINKAAVNQPILDELEFKNAELQSDKRSLIQQVNQLQQELIEKPIFDSDALNFLQERHPDLSKEEILKIALDCSATNEGEWKFTVYSFTDYVKREKSFTNYQNNVA